MRLAIFTSVIALCFLISCSQRKSDKVDKEQIPITEKGAGKLSIMQLDERLRGADSLVFVFYKDPQGKDSLRYSRYYKQYASIDSVLINFVKRNLMDSTSRFEKVKKCRSEGKIWCFTSGDIFQTIYFSSFNTECSFLYIIKDGQFYYSPHFTRNEFDIKGATEKGP